jgi:hypothetical protein
VLRGSNFAFHCSKLSFVGRQNTIKYFCIKRFALKSMKQSLRLGSVSPQKWITFYQSLGRNLQEARSRGGSGGVAVAMRKEIEGETFT